MKKDLGNGKFEVKCDYCGKTIEVEAKGYIDCNAQIIKKDFIPFKTEGGKWKDTCCCMCYYCLSDELKNGMRKND